MIFYTSHISVLFFFRSTFHLLCIIEYDINRFFLGAPLKCLLSAYLYLNFFVCLFIYLMAHVKRANKTNSCCTNSFLEKFAFPDQV